MYNELDLRSFETRHRTFAKAPCRVGRKKQPHRFFFRCSLFIFSFFCCIFAVIFKDNTNITNKPKTFKVMRVIIEPDYANLSRWAAEYVAAKINAANPTPEKPFKLGCPTGSSPSFHRIARRWLKRAFPSATAKASCCRRRKES